MISAQEMNVFLEAIGSDHRVEPYDHLDAGLSAMMKALPLFVERVSKDTVRKELVRRGIEPERD